MDRYFTSVTHYLKEKKMKFVGTMRAIRKLIPKKLVEMQNRDYKDIEFVYANEDDLMLTSYVVKKKSDKRNILKLSAMHDDVAVMKRKNGAPVVFMIKRKVVLIL